MLLLNSAPASAASPSAAASADEMISAVRSAQDGCPHAFAKLFRMYYPGMLAVANGMLGRGPEAEDACQDAAITAFARIGELRDPAAVRSWLHMIVRNNCRTVLRARRPIPVGVAGQDLVASDADDPVACIERSAMRDWIWHGLRQLSPALQPVAMLRYYTENNSYEQIAALCAIPVGTVRSRLSEVRRRLAEILPGSLDHRHEDAGPLAAERRAEATAILSAVADGAGMERFGGRWADDLTMWWPDGQRTTDLRALFDTMGEDHAGGVTYRLTGVVAGDGVTIWENEFVNPPDNPDHCPPAATWLLREKRRQVCEVRLLHAPRKTSRTGERATGCRPS
jgi:RNA polymerase sigma-70 factor (ECF subfamily)